MIDWLISCLRGRIEGSVPRRTGKEYDLKDFDDLWWIAGHKNMSHPKIPYVYGDITPSLYGKAIERAVEKIDDKNDCADFTALKLVDLVLETGDLLLHDEENAKRIERCLTGFSFWITDSKKDSMCYYSENHQICFATVEYLAGTLYPDAVFSCDGK
ncbi:MAG: hypothetical protein ILP13_01010, partial [Lachnospiraceae bacterium]|nr:hypothetical protein [Lachnospiraceae bacterium]